MEHDIHGIEVAAFTYRSSIDSDISLGWAGWAAPAHKSFMSEWWLLVCAGRHRFKAFRKEDNMLRLSKMNRSEARLGVGVYNNHEWQLGRIGRWMEYACGVKSETIKLDSIVPLRSAWTSFLSEEMLGCTLQVSLEYTSRVSRYATSPRCCLDSLSISGWLDIRSWISLRREVDSDSRVQLTENQSLWLIDWISRISSWL